MDKLFYSKFSNTLRFFSLSLLFTVFNSSGEVRCDLTMESCLDYNSSGEVTISVPNNTTRIAKDNILLCMPTFTVNTTVDFVFAVDQSRSMAVDTKSDPDFLTPVATTNAINAINAISPTSTVGFFGFSNGICDGTQKESISGQGSRFTTKPDTRVPPAPLNSPGHKDKLLAQTNYNSKDFHFGCGSVQPGGTNHNRAIRTARSWLDTLASPHKDVIIFVTDGVQTTEQTEFTELVNSADSSFPVVYTLFLTDTTGGKAYNILFNSKDLVSLTKKTGGGFHFVGNAGLVDSVMQKIIQETIQVGSPSSTIVTNTTNGSKALGINQKSGGKDNEYQMSLDSIIALNLNQNSVAFSTSNGQDTYSKNVTINVDAPAITTKGKTALSNGLFDVFCYDKSTLIPTDKNFQPISVVTFEMDAIGVALQTSSDISNNQVVSITSAGTADETLVLDTNNRNTINFAIGAAQPANTIVEGNGGDSLGMFWVNPRDPRDNAKAFLPISEAPEMQSWIIDGDGDGRADSIFIEFAVRIPTIPSVVSNIHWPDNNSEVKSGVANPTGPELNSVRFFNYLQTIIVVDLSKDQFEFGATSASTVSPPTLTAFKTVVTIQDSVKPFLISAVKKPSDHGRYMRLSDSSTTNFPDTLTITLSEPITPAPNATAPWTSLLLVKKGYDLIPVVVLKELKVLSEDKRTYQVIFENKPGDKTIKAGDTISLNPEAFYLDTKGNTMNPMAVELTGYDNSNSGLCTAWRGGPVSGDQEEFTSFSTCPYIPVVDETTNTIVGHVATANVVGWVPPVGFDHTTGNIDFTAQTNDLCYEAPAARTKTRFPTECFASRLLLTEFSNGPYIAHINIYDHLGTFIRHLKQAFGFCGELQNPARATESGLIINDLVWNLQDIDGDRVGTGVYIWQVRLRFSKGGYDKVRVYKMGYLSKGNDLNTPCNPQEF